MDLEYHVNLEGSKSRIFNSFNDAAGFVLARAGSTGAADATIDVICWSKAGARAYGGDDAVARYKEDPDASVFERLEVSVKINNAGRIA